MSTMSHSHGLAPFGLQPLFESNALFYLNNPRRIRVMGSLLLVNVLARLLDYISSFPATGVGINRQSASNQILILD